MAHGLLIDMDGVVYGGDTMIPGADIFAKMTSNIYRLFCVFCSTTA